MSIHNHAGDVLLESKVNIICESIKQLTPQKQDEIIYQLQNIITNHLQYKTLILSRNTSRKFPQVFREDNLLYIRYHFIKDKVSIPPKDNIFMQISIGTVLACCSHECIVDIKIDETIGSFSQRYPWLVNYATLIYDLLISKVQ